jgi:uncharacterized protein (TIGR02145 family)
MKTNLVLLAFISSLIAFASCDTKDDKNPDDNSGVKLKQPVFNSAKVYGTMTDQDGNSYKTIRIGTQTWMAENLRTTHYRNGDAIRHLSSSANWIHDTVGGWCTYENTTDDDSIAVYGLLYNWFVVSDVRNVAPLGWHVPSKDELTVLKEYLSDDANAGNFLRETGDDHWISPNDETTNSTGFTAIPGGARNASDGTFGGIRESVAYWTSTPSGVINFSYCLRLDDLMYPLIIEYFTKNCGMSIRCIKD